MSRRVSKFAWNEWTWAISPKSIYRLSRSSGSTECLFGDGEIHEGLVAADTDSIGSSSRILSVVYPGGIDLFP